MSNVINGIVRTYEQESTTVAKYLIVENGTAANEVALGSGVAGELIGVATESATGVDGEPVGVVVSGYAKVVMSAAQTRGTQVTSTAAGKGVLAVAGDILLGYLDEEVTAADQVARVFLAPRGVAV